MITKDALVGLSATLYRVFFATLKLGLPRTLYAVIPGSALELETSYAIKS